MNAMPTSTHRPICKLIVVLYRRSDFTRAQVLAYLRAVHGPMAERLPGLVADRQNHVIDDATRAHPGWDAVVELWWNSREEMEAAWRTPEGRSATGDLAAFADQSRTSWSIVEEFIRR